MKRKIISVLLTLVLVLSLSLITAVPAGASPGTLKVVPYTLQTGDNAASWSTTQKATGSYSVLLNYVSGDNSYVEFTPATGITVNDLASITDGWSWWYYASAAYGPILELRFTEAGYDPGDGWGHVDITVDTAEVSPFITTGTTEEVTNASTCIYFGNDPTDGTSFFDNTGGVTLAGVLAAINAKPEMTTDTATDWELTRVRVEIGWSAPARTCYIDDIKIAGVTYYGKIQDAIDTAIADDTITVAAGAYTEEITVDKDLTITCTATCTINGDVHFDASSITMTDATLDTGYEWYVDSDTASIQDAIDASSDSDTINVAAGEYNEQVYINKANLIVQSVSGAATTIIDGTGLDSGMDALVWLQENGIIFKGFTVQNCPRTAGGAALWVAKVTPGISACVVTENIIAETNESVYSILLTAASTCEVSDNVISASGLNGVTFSGSEGECLNNTITLNTITGSRGCAINLHSGATASFAGTVISENIIHGGGFGIALGEANGTSGDLIVIRDNDVHDVVTGLGGSPANGISTNNSSYVDVYSNDVKDGIKGIAVYGTHANVTFRYNDIAGNSLYGLDATNATGGNVYAKCNYWGTAAGPLNATNPGVTAKMGNAVSDGVDYAPWIYKTLATTGDTVAEIYSNQVPAYANAVILDVVGWNTWSVPIGLDGQYNTWAKLITLTGLDYSLAYRFDSSSQTFVILARTTAYAIAPGEGFYIKMDTAGSIPYCYSTLPSVPSRNLSAGWSMIGGGMGAETELLSCTSIATVASTAGYTQILSPTQNALDWVWRTGDTTQGFFVLGEGYWVSLPIARILCLVDLTPVAFEAVP